MLRWCLSVFLRSACSDRFHCTTSPIQSSRALVRRLHLLATSTASSFSFNPLLFPSSSCSSPPSLCCPPSPIPHPDSVCLCLSANVRLLIHVFGSSYGSPRDCVLARTCERVRVCARVCRCLSSTSASWRYTITQYIHVRARGCMSACAQVFALNGLLVSALALLFVLYAKEVCGSVCVRARARARARESLPFVVEAKEVRPD
jgi:hypothetical protein